MVTLPDRHTSNGLNVLDLAREFRGGARVRYRRGGITHSTLGGPGKARGGRREVQEMVVTLSTA